MNRPRNSAERRARKRNVAWQNEQRKRAEREAAHHKARQPSPTQEEPRPNVQ